MTNKKTKKRQRSNQEEEQTASRSAGTTNTATAIGILSDTHGVLDEAVVEILRTRGVRGIVHGGDIGPGKSKSSSSSSSSSSRLSASELLARLREVAPVHAVSGNVDDDEAAGGRGGGLQVCEGRSLHVTKAETLEFQLAGLRLWLSHGHHFPIKPAKAGATSSSSSSSGVIALTSTEARARIEAAAPDVVVCGHTHQPVTGRLGAGGPIFINPGSAGPQRFSLPRCFVVATVSEEEEGGAAGAAAAAKRARGEEAGREKRRRSLRVERYHYNKANGQWAVGYTQLFEL